MSNFDNIIHDLMNEEEHFPRKNVNWRQLSERLEVYEAAHPLPKESFNPYLKVVLWRYLAAASIALTMIASAWFYIKMKEVTAENIAIKEELKVLKNNELQREINLNKWAEGREKNAIALEKAGILSAQNESAVNQSQQVAAYRTTPSVTTAQKGRFTPNISMPFKHITQQNFAIPEGFNFNKNKNSDSKIDNLHTPSVQQDIIAVENENKAIAVVQNIGNESNTVNNTPSVETASTDIINIRNNALLAEIQLITPQSLYVNNLRQMSWADIDLDVNTSAPIVQKRRARFNLLPKGLNIGINGTTGRHTPIIAGVKAILGKGVSADLNVTRRLSIGMQVDWVSSEFEFKKPPPRSHVHLPDTPFHPIHERLEKIDGMLYSRIIGGNFQYKLTTQSWVNPYVKASYSWSKVTPKFIDFEFRDNNTGNKLRRPLPPMPSEVNKNLVSVGIGLEKNIGRWGINASLDYYKDLSSTDNKTDDMALLRGGVKYRIY
jgi:hypothetical protein